MRETDESRTSAPEAGGTTTMPTLRKPIKPFFNREITPTTPPVEETPMPSLRKPIKPFFNPESTPNEESSNDALSTLAFFSLLMFTLPIGVFFLVRDFLVEGDYDEIYVLVGSVLASIMTVNLIIVLYVVRAFMVENREQKEKMQ